MGAARQVQGLWDKAESTLDFTEAFILQRPVNGVSPPTLEELREKEEEASAASWAAAAASRAALELTAEDVIRQACAYVESRLN